MNTSVATHADAIPDDKHQTSTWQDDFLVHLLPRVRTHAHYRFRDLPRGEREETAR